MPDLGVRGAEIRRVDHRRLAISDRLFSVTMIRFENVNVSPELHLSSCIRDTVNAVQRSPEKEEPL